MDPDFKHGHAHVNFRIIFAEHISKKLSTQHIHKEPGKDAIIVDYFSHGLSAANLKDEIDITKKALEKADFPDGKSEVIQKGDDTLLRFEGRETLEMLVQFGVRFDGWEDYKNETLIDRPLG